MKFSAFSSPSRTLLIAANEFILLSGTIPSAFPSDDWKQALVLTGILRSDTSVKATVITLLIISCYWTDVSF